MADTTTETVETVTENTETTATIETPVETVQITKEEFDKKIQSETDKVRTEYSKKIKELENQVKQLTPVTKSDAELDFEKRLAALEEREKAMALTEKLAGKGISNEFSAFLRPDVDVDALSVALENYLKNKATANSYVPNGHKSGDSLTKEDFKNLSMAEKEKLYTTNPELYKTLAGR